MAAHVGCDGVYEDEFSDPLGARNMREMTQAKVKALNFKAMTPLEFAEIYDKLPNCFVCGSKANGTNRYGEMWTCGEHYDMALEDELALKHIGYTNLYPHT